MTVPRRGGPDSGRDDLLWHYFIPSNEQRYGGYEVRIFISEEVPTTRHRMFGRACEIAAEPLNASSSTWPRQPSVSPVSLGDVSGNGSHTGASVTPLRALGSHRFSGLKKWAWIGGSPFGKSRLSSHGSRDVCEEFEALRRC